MANEKITYICSRCGEKETCSKGDYEWRMVGDFLGNTSNKTPICDSCSEKDNRKLFYG